MLKSIIALIIMSVSANAIAGGSYHNGIWHTKDGKEITVIGDSVSVNYLNDRYDLSGGANYADVNTANNTIIVTITDKDGDLITYEGK